MRNIKLTIAYDGTRYSGWQSQSNTDMTVQKALAEALAGVTGESPELIASGRTDAGVHAAGQVVSFKLKNAMSCAELKAALNTALPSDIAALSAENAHERFHARYNVRKKRYTYRVVYEKDPFMRRYAYLCEPLDIAAMEKASRFMLGEHDFAGFSSLGKPKPGKKSTVRAVYGIELVSRENGLEMSFSGDGFLYNMVRIMAGTLIEVGQGSRPPESVAIVLETCDRKLAGMTAPPHGLCLADVLY